jgi:RNA polymerase sigma-70 factor (TIGR02943 family)
MTEEEKIIDPGSDFEIEPQAWIDAYGDYLLRFAQARVGNRETTEDLVQETFLAAWNSRFSFRGESSLKTWLTSILKHKILDHYRRHASEAAFAELLKRHGDKESQWILEDALFPSAWRETPVDTLERQELYDTFLKCSDTLPSRMKEAFMFAEVDGLSGLQISERLDISVANARTLVHRAKKAMRACLEYVWSRWKKG